MAACVLAIIVVLLLAPALGSLRFEPARPMTRSADVEWPQILSDLRPDDNSSLGEIILFWLALVVPAILVLLMLPPELRKRLLQHVIRFALFVLALVLALRYRLINLPEINSAELTSGQGGFQTPGDLGESGSFVAPSLPPWLIYLISFLLIALLTLGVYMIYRVWERNHSRRYSSLKVIAAVARQSLDDLAHGRQWGNVVVEAYARMTEAVQIARGVQRNDSWTAREFATRLASNGLPASAVHELTRLFEAARYGGTLADETATRRATSCLESILQACRTAA